MKSRVTLQDAMHVVGELEGFEIPEAGVRRARIPDGRIRMIRAAACSCPS